MTAERRYSDVEVRRILRRATETPPAAGALPPGGGLSLAELEEVAREVGIEPAEVRRAALSELPPPAPSVGARLVGGAARHRHTLFVPGRLPPERRREVTTALERVLARDVTLTEEDGRAVWEEDHRQGWTRLTARDVEGGVEVEVEADRRGWLTLIGVGSVAVAAALVPLVAVLLPGGLAAALPWAVLAGGGAAVAGTRMAWSPAARRMRRRVEASVGEVVGRIEPPEETP